VPFNRETVSLILLEDVRERKICTKFVARSLTDEQRSMELQFVKASSRPVRPSHLYFCWRHVLGVSV
jgi:hypothetical protein